MPKFKIEISNTVIIEADTEDKAVEKALLAMKDPKDLEICHFEELEEVH